MDTFKWLFLELGLTNLVFKKDVRNMVGVRGEIQRNQHHGCPRQGDVKQKYIANTPFNEVFQNDSSQSDYLIEKG